MVHSFDVPSTIFAVPVARLYGTPAVLSSQRAYRDLSSGLYRRLLRVTDRLVDGIVVNCQAIKLHLVEQERVAERLIHVCYNGLDSELFCPPPSPRRRVAPLEGASLVIGTLCGLRPEKDLKTLVEAFSSIREIVPGAKLAIVGSGSEQDDLRGRVQALGCEGDCIFQDATTEVASWLRSFDIYVLPSRSEALSNVLMEAMACGCAVVASRVGGNPELVSDAKTGLLFEPGDWVQLAARLRELMTDAALRERLSRSAAQRIRQDFTLSQAARQMEAVYFHYLERAGPEMKVAPTEHK
jgi:glycosyltransferase involved in cell wall biosynthesis